ncbi:recombinase family protein [Anaerocolumna sp. AGMB13025]|uniref:recombinase family protein n=1 Tax=Anaerocolumna sp. AGMB13025 TaxID=3039116 RepID=UPI00241F1343|nr:recombinase family protein [Anaerocolumna sp. AGMB13025]WFR55412.1 recombinase family protein [Anaerocolumna sp. AGMB13025]
MKIFIYSRKSVYTGKGESVENQIEMCKEYITAKLSSTDKAVITVYEDEGFSAKNTDRPQFQQMIRDIKLNKPEYIVCYRLDRISRNVSDFSSLIEYLNNHNISFICIKEEFDTSKPMGKAMMYIASVFAQLERETIAERVRDNMLMLARTGRWLGGTTPTGFTSEKVQEIVIDGKIKTACKLKDNPDELKIIDCIYEKFLEFRSISGVSKYLIKQGIRSRTGKMFSLLGIKEILQNPVYCIADEDVWNYFSEHHADICFDKSECSNKYALLAYNKRDYRKKNAPRQEIDKWIIAIGKHKGRVSGKKWVAIQNILKDNVATGTKPALMHNDYSLLSGLIYCDKCKSRMFAKHRSGKGANNGLYDYICNNKLRGGMDLCDCQNINGQQADDLVCEHLMLYTNENSVIYKLLNKLKRDLQGQTQKNPLVIIDDKIKKCNSEIKNLINTLSHGNIGSAFIEHINIKINELDKELASLKEEKIRLQKDTTIISDKELLMNILSSALSNFKGNFYTLSVEEKRTLIKLMVQKIVWDGNDLHVYIYGE